MIYMNKKAVAQLMTAATLSVTFSTIASVNYAVASAAQVTPIQVTIKQASDAAKKAKEATVAVTNAEKALTQTIKVTDKAKQNAKNLVSQAEQNLSQANKNLTQAKISAENAAKAQADAKKALVLADAQDLVNAPLAVANANKLLAAANSALTNANQRLAAANSALTTANSNLDTATTKLSVAENAKNQAIAQAQLMVENADQKVQDATSARDQAQLNAETAANQSLDAQQAVKKAADWSTLERLPIKDKFKALTPLKLTPDIQKLLSKEGVAISGDQVNAQKLDFTQLFLKRKHNVRVSFINEGANYKNQLAYEAFKTNYYSKGMIFENISCNSTKNKCLHGEKDGVLDIGDFVDLGTFEAGTQLNFLLKADGDTTPSRNGDIYGSDPSLNPDGLQHIMAWNVGDYLIMGFEDLRGGGDKDYNDIIFAVDLGKNNYKPTLISEPSATFAILGVGAVGMLKLRRRRQNQKVEQSPKQPTA